MSSYDYTTDNVGRRTKVDDAGAAFYFTGWFDWLYNDRNEIASARRCKTYNSQEVTSDRRSYVYDTIGNRGSALDLGGQSLQYYCHNALNQYTTTSSETNCPPSQPAESFSYDNDGNLTLDGGFTRSWDAENRLSEVVPRFPSQGGPAKLEFTYDYRNRRVPARQARTAAS